MRQQKRLSAKELSNGSKAAVMTALDKLLEAKDHFTHTAETAGLDIKYEAEEQVRLWQEAQLLANEWAVMWPGAQRKPLATVGMVFLAGLVISRLLMRK